MAKTDLDQFHTNLTLRTGLALAASMNHLIAVVREINAGGTAPETVDSQLREIEAGLEGLITQMNKLKERVQ